MGGGIVAVIAVMPTWCTYRNTSAFLGQKSVGSVSIVTSATIEGEKLRFAASNVTGKIGDWGLETRKMGS